LFSILKTPLERFEQTIDYIEENRHQQRSEILSWPLTVINQSAKRISDKIDKNNKAQQKAVDEATRRR
jgi:hypothetical protein